MKPFLRADLCATASAAAVAPSSSRTLESPRTLLELPGTAARVFPRSSPSARGCAPTHPPWNIVSKLFLREDLCATTSAAAVTQRVSLTLESCATRALTATLLRSSATERGTAFWPRRISIKTSLRARSLMQARAKYAKSSNGPSEPRHSTSRSARKIHSSAGVPTTPAAPTARKIPTSSRWEFATDRAHLADGSRSKKIASYVRCNPLNSLYRRLPSSATASKVHASRPSPPPPSAPLAAAATTVPSLASATRTAEAPPQRPPRVRATTPEAPDARADAVNSLRTPAKSEEPTCRTYNKKHTFFGSTPAKSEPKH